MQTVLLIPIKDTANLCVFTNNPTRMQQVLLRSVTLIIISTIYAVSISDKVRFTEAATGVNHVFNVHRKTPVLVSLLQYSCKPSSLQLYSKEISTQVFSCEYCEIFENIYFEEHLRAAALSGETIERTN